MKFYIGLHQPSDARFFPRACISINRMDGHRQRQKPLGCPDVLIDSGAFSELHLYGAYRHPVAHYAARIRRLDGVAQITAVVAEDYMCEPFILQKTGFTVAEHQRLTIERYDALLDEGLDVPVLPVLQGYAPDDYARHVEQYGDRLAPGAWVGVGSVCKRNRNPVEVARVLHAVRAARPDLRLHGFGVKKTTLADAEVRRRLHSADSMAWSFHARRNGRSANDRNEALAYVQELEAKQEKARIAPSLPFLA